MFPVLVHLGPITIYSFGVMLAVAFLLCGHLLGRELERRSIRPELAGTVVTWAIVGGLLGAKLYYLVERWDEVRTAPFSNFFSGAGLVAHGGFLGGILLCWITVRRHGESFLEVSDAAAPLLALGYAIGRVGCFLAGDGDYGPPTDLPWGMAFPDGIVPTTVPVHPTPLYEIAMMLPVFAFLWRLRLRPWPRGKLFAVYLVAQGVERCISELYRAGRVPVWLGLHTAQLVALGSALVGVIWLFWLRLRGAAPATG